MNASTSALGGVTGIMHTMRQIDSQRSQLMGRELSMEEQILADALDNAWDFQKRQLMKLTGISPSDPGWGAKARGMM